MSSSENEYRSAASPSEGRGRPKAKVYLGIGSNLGDRATNIKRACGALSALLDRFEQASLYETRPRDVTDQPLFLNTVVSGFSSLVATELLTRIHGIEEKNGRNRSNEREKGPRTIDIDLLLYGTELIDDDDIVVPHPRMIERKFVLVPLVELDPQLNHPLSGISFQSYLESLESQGIYYFHATRYSREISGHRQER